MDWINVNDKFPNKYEEVIVCSNEGTVKSAVCLGNGKWTTYLQITHWMYYPEPPVVSNEENKEDKKEETPVEPVKKKRGRPKKNG